MVPPEEFTEQVKHALENLYDFSYLQQHPLNRHLQLNLTANSTNSTSEQLRRELIDAIDTLNPGNDIPFSDPRARLYNLLLLHYVEGRTIQETANELGLSVRQTYRNLRDGYENVAAILWSRKQSPADQEQRAIHLSSMETELGRLDREPQPIEIDGLIENALESVDSLAMQRNVIIEKILPGEPVTVLTDPVMAQQLLVNTLSNTIRQSQPGKLILELGYRSKEAVLFLRYQKDINVNSHLMTQSVTQIMDRLGWRVEQGKSSSNHEQNVQLYMTAQEPTILVIDDNEGLVQLLERYLANHNCRVAIATSGQQGLQLAQKLSPSAIILDGMMPKMDGWGVLQRLRTLPHVVDTPVIICSVFDDPELAYSLGAAHFLPKPISRSDVLFVLHQLGIVKQRGRKL